MELLHERTNEASAARKASIVRKPTKTAAISWSTTTNHAQTGSADTNPNPIPSPLLLQYDQILLLDASSPEAKPKPELNQRNGKWNPPPTTAPATFRNGESWGDLGRFGDVHRAVATVVIWCINGYSRNSNCANCGVL